MEQKEAEASKSRWRGLVLLLALLLAAVLGYLWLRPADEVAAPAAVTGTLPEPERAEANDGGRAPAPEAAAWGAFVQSWTPRDGGRAAPAQAAQEPPPEPTATAAGDGGAEPAPYAWGEVPNAGSISGQVFWRGTPPVLPPLAHNKDQKVCGSSGPDDSLLVSPDGGLANVVISLEGVARGKPPLAQATLDQVGCAYVPRVQAVTVGTTLTVVNSDPILHDVHASLGATTVFNLAMPIHNQKIPTKLSRLGLIKLKCDVHGWMTGAIDVVQNPYFAVTDADGRFSITGIPAGSYVLSVWHERVGQKRQAIAVTPDQARRVKFSIGSPGGR